MDTTATGTTSITNNTTSTTASNNKNKNNKKNIGRLQTHTKRHNTSNAAGAIADPKSKQGQPRRGRGHSPGRGRGRGAASLDQPAATSSQQAQPSTRNRGGGRHRRRRPRKDRLRAHALPSHSPTAPGHLSLPLPFVPSAIELPAPLPAINTSKHSIISAPDSASEPAAISPNPTSSPSSLPSAAAVDPLNHLTDLATAVADIDTDSDPTANMSSEATTQQRQIDNACVIVPDRLYFATVRQLPPSTPEAFFFTVDSEFKYEAFCADFGPFNLSTSVRFCRKLWQFLEQPQHKDQRIYFCTGTDMQVRSNAAALIGLFAVWCLNMTDEQAIACLDTAKPPFAPFRDASYAPVLYKLHVRYVISGAYQALLNGFIDVHTFDLDTYDHFERVENGDFTTIIPNKFIALAGPHNTRHVDDGYTHLAPENLFEPFRRLGVTDIVRLNKKMYDRTKFTQAGFAHHDLFFIDGTCPPPAILESFLEITEKCTGTAVVHCKAGLGRTGSLIGCYMMKHYRFNAPETIAWLRIARPGSVIGPQQTYLVNHQADMWLASPPTAKRKGEADRPLAAITDLAAFHIVTSASKDENATAPTTPTKDAGHTSLSAVARALSDIIPSIFPDDSASALESAHTGAANYIPESERGSSSHDHLSQGDILTRRKAQAQHKNQPLPPSRTCRPTTYEPSSFETF